MRSLILLAVAILVGALGVYRHGFDLLDSLALVLCASMVAAATHEKPDPKRPALALLVALALLPGCVTRGEHKAFVEASRAFFDGVSPVFSAATLADPDLADQSKANRLASVKAYEKALVAAEGRVK